MHGVVDNVDYGIKLAQKYFSDSIIDSALKFFEKVLIADNRLR